MLRPFRSLAKAPGYSLVVVAIMALGIAAATALYSVVDAVLLQPLAYRDSGRLVTLHTVFAAKGRTSRRVTGGDFRDLRSSLHSFSALAIYQGGEMGVRIDDHARFVPTFRADPAFFRALDVTPIAGRLPDSTDAGQAALITASFASTNWSNPAAALGHTIFAENRPYRVAGVVADSLAFPEHARVWLTGPIDPENQNHSAFNYYAVGRLRHGTTVRQAQEELNTVASHIARANPGSNDGKTFRVLSLQDDITGSSRATLIFLLCAAGLLLLIALANSANLALSRAATRTREMAVRLSLGSGLGSIARLLLAEGLILSCAANALGLALAYASLQAISPLIPVTVPRSSQALQLRGTMIAFAAVISGLTVLVCTIVPILNVGRLDLADALKRTGGRGLVGTQSRSRELAVLAQIALCAVLCVGATLLSRTLLVLLHTPLGFRTENTLVVYADAPANDLPQYLAAIRTVDAAVENIRHLPGVRSAAATMGLPTGHYGSNGSYLVEGVDVQPGQDIFAMNWPRNVPEAVFALAAPRYFETLGIHLLAGRDFSERDSYSAAFTAIISQALARRSFGNASPLGRRIYCGLDSPKPMTIVGVVSDVRQNSPASEFQAEIYMPLAQHPVYANEAQLVVSTYHDPSKLLPAVRQHLRQTAPTLATSFTTLSDMVQDSIAAPRFRTVLILSFAFLAVALAMAGVYSVMAFYVNQRRLEFGLRMALGAAPSSIAKLAARKALTLTVAGLVIGIAIAVALSRFAESLLYGVRTLDLPTYGIGAGIVLLAALVASGIPTWHASQTDPAVILRDE